MTEKTRVAHVTIASQFVMDEEDDGFLVIRILDGGVLRLAPGSSIEGVHIGSRHMFPDGVPAKITIRDRRS